MNSARPFSLKPFATYVHLRRTVVQPRSSCAQKCVGMLSNLCGLHCGGFLGGCRPKYDKKRSPRVGEFGLGDCRAKGFGHFESGLHK